jgi:hypothetical protein
LKPCNGNRNGNKGGRTAWKLRAVFGSLVSLSFPSVFIGKMDPEIAFVSSFPRLDTGNRKQTRAGGNKNGN